MFHLYGTDLDDTDEGEIHWIIKMINENPSILSSPGSSLLCFYF